MILSNKLKFVIIFVAVALSVGLVSAAVITYVLTPSTPKPVVVTPGSQTVEIPVGITVPATVTDLQTFTLTATITDSNGNGKPVKFYKDGALIGTEVFEGGTASITVGPYAVGTYQFSAGP